MAQHNILLETGTNELEIIEFGLKYKDAVGEVQTQPLGINVTKVREIIRMPDLTVLPNLPEGVKGVFSLRDQIFPALNLGYFLYGPDQVDDCQTMIIAEFNEIRLGLSVTYVDRIHRISWQDVMPPASIQQIDPNHATVVGIISIMDKTIMMIDVEKIVADIDPRLAMQDLPPSKDRYGEHFKILTAEDSEVIRRLITQELSKTGFDIISINDGQAAWDALSGFANKIATSGESLSNYVDVVITDIEMPRMDGYTLTKLIKEHPILSSLPVIIFSSMVSEDNRHKGTSVGADAQLTKPQVSMLLDTVRSFLPERHPVH